MLSDSELMQVVVDSIVETLNIEPGEVVPSALLTPDLGMESIDYLDCAFRLEKRLRIKVQFDKAIPPEQLKLDDQGRLTPQTVALIQEQYPGMDGEQLQSKAWPSVLQDVLSVQVLFNYLKQRLQGQRHPT